MSLSIGIVGLPNVGKSTLFNAITNSSVDANNYPFCTIEPNIGIVPIPDERVDKLAEISNSEKKIYSTIEFVDIAGLVKGASKGEGLGNQFLSHVREVSAIAHVVRCFEDENIVHVNGSVDPLRDIDIINTELLLADLSMAEKIMNNQLKKSKSGDKVELEKYNFCKKIYEHLEKGNPIRTLKLEGDEILWKKGLSFLTEKHVIYVANVNENELSTGNKYTEKVKKFAYDNNDEFVIISAKIESELSELEEDERKEFMKELGIKDSGLSVLIKKSFSLLGLQCFLTTGKKETRSWTIKKGMTAPQAAGVIHSDFERGFIRANIVSYDDFIELGSMAKVKEAGKLRQEGKDYIMKEGDIVEFLFNV